MNVHWWVSGQLACVDFCVGVFKWLAEPPVEKTGQPQAWLRELLLNFSVALLLCVMT